MTWPLTPLDSKASLLSRELASQHIDGLTALANQIPSVSYQPHDLLAEQKEVRQLYNKWDHSLILLEDDRPIGFIMGYERQAENNEQYPKNSLYISELAVLESHQNQGIGRSLLEQFLFMNNTAGFLTLDGALHYSVQTNSARWNRHVRELYESFGFKKRATKDYANRTDIVLSVCVDQLIY
jgi:ribosomal protein S18 acetylase RimI-like enzyme